MNYWIYISIFLYLTGIMLVFAYTDEQDKKLFDYVQAIFWFVVLYIYLLMILLDKIEKLYNKLKKK